MATSVRPQSNGTAPQAVISQTVEKLEVDCLKLLDALETLRERNEEQSLRLIGDVAGLSKDEVNRYLNPQVNEVYSLERLVHVRGANRPLYNHLIVSGPPKTEDGQWVGIQANTSKWNIFRAVAQKYGYLVRFVGERGTLVEFEYVGIETLSYARQGIAFSFQEPVLYLDQFRPA